MGGYDDAEVCQLVGTFILSKLGNIIGKKNTSLCRDDGLVIRVLGRYVQFNNNLMYAL